ncbi:ABC transporter ATP-binding protein [Candidatus Bathyarchaeota archaeon]|nr:ABC transporter ATP-binding protein [Candidatus Bathyarchaeota archaeon]
MSVELRGIWKSYGKITVLKGLTLGVQKGEFLCVLGLSGCGKTTMLNIIAGILRQDRGDVLIDGDVINEKPPEERPIGMVFQDYLLFPHLNVFENIAFGLKAKSRNLPEKEARGKIYEILNLLKIEHLKDRYPTTLSGGEQQRAALARALVLEPKVLLMDEPLSNLDAVTRESLRFELKKLHRRLGVTTIYVTHDRVEALTLADRLAILHDGKIEQIGEPKEVFFKPKTEAVASLVGAENRFRGYISAIDLDEGVAKVTAGSLEIVVPFEDYFKVGDHVCVFLRPDDITVHFEKFAGVNVFKGIVEDLFLTGSFIRVKVSVGEHYFILDIPREVASEKEVNVNKAIYVSFKPNAVVCLRRPFCRCPLSASV